MNCCLVCDLEFPGKGCFKLSFIPDLFRALVFASRLAAGFVGSDKKVPSVSKTLRQLFLYSCLRSSLVLLLFFFKSSASYLLVEPRERPVL